MTKNKLVRTIVMCSAMAVSSMVFAQGPVQNIDASKHANLASAQASIAHAYQKIDAAQQVNRAQLGDHAQKAKDLLVQASQELKLAAEYANHRK
jgi:predicted lipoprotein with Yx(FWY)xxD motif